MSKEQRREARRDRADEARRQAALSTDWAAHYAPKPDRAPVTPKTPDAALTAAVDDLRAELAAAPVRPGSARELLARIKLERDA